MTTTTETVETREEFIANLKAFMETGLPPGSTKLLKLLGNGDLINGIGALVEIANTMPGEFSFQDFLDLEELTNLLTKHNVTWNDLEGTK